MPYESWYETDTAGDVLSRERLLGEIKINLINVITDYKGLGINNEDALIAQVHQLFLGEIIPTRKDWTTLTNVLEELSTVKEQGQMYAYFIRDVSDSLGISDLEKIKAFIDYIQTLPPVDAPIQVRLNPPVMYTITKPLDSTSNKWSNATIKWGLSANYLNKPTAKIVANPSVSEDVKKYIVTITAGSYTKTEEYTPAQLKETTLTLDWLSWFAPSQLKNAFVQVDVAIVDKRENETLNTQKMFYPTSVTIPQGVQNYQLEYKRDNSNWQRITTTTSTQHNWKVPRVNGTYQYRVRGLDKSGIYTNWSLSDPRYIRFIPDPPDKPKPRISKITIDTATITWPAVPRAEFYEVWHGGEKWAKENTGGGKMYWKRLKAGDKLSVNMRPMNAGKTYTWYVRAINEGGENIGSVKGTMKKKVLKTVTYKPTGYRIWRGTHTVRSRWDKYTAQKAKWRSDALYQSGWRDAIWSYSPKSPGWDLRSGGAYWAWGNQQWGNHMSFLFFNYSAMRSKLKGKEIQSVSITFKRYNSIHGWPKAKPLYLYNHSKANNSKAPSNFPFYREDRVNVTRNTQRATANVTFSRGGAETITNAKTKRLIQNIVDGHYTGIGLVKYHGSSFNASLPTADVAYMILAKNVSVKIKYYEIQ